MKLKKGDFNYYTYDITDRLSTKDSQFCISALNFNGDYLDAFRLVDSIAWHFNEATHSAIEMLIATLNLPKNYIGCQIRGGDKNIEFKIYSPDVYIDKLRAVSSLKNVFVLTDIINYWRNFGKRLQTITFIHSANLLNGDIIMYFC